MKLRQLFLVFVSLTGFLAAAQEMKELWTQALAAPLTTEVSQGLYNSSCATGIPLLGAGVSTPTTCMNLTGYLYGNGATGITAATTVPTTSLSGNVPVANGGTNISSGQSGGVLGFTSSGVIASSTPLTANLPVIGGGAGATPQSGSVSGNTTEFATANGVLVNGHCVSIDSHGNFVDAGGACTTGGGGGTVASGNNNQVAYYTSTGTVIGGFGPVNNAVVITNSVGTPTESTILPNGLNLGTPSTLTLTNATGLTNSGLVNSAVTVNGTSISLGASQTVTAAAGTLTGATLNSGVTASSLTSVGALTGGSTGSGFTVALGTATLTGVLGYTNGGCNATSQTLCADNIFPLATSTGTVAYWNGVNWASLTGNNSGTAVLQETSAGIPSWVAGGGGVSSFNTRTGAVVPANGDYTTQQLTTISSGSAPAAGKLGEVISADVPVGSAISLTAFTATDVTSLNISAGSWACSGNVAFTTNASSTVSLFTGYVTQTSATSPTPPNGGSFVRQAFTPSGLATANAYVYTLAPLYVNASGSTPIYLGAFEAFTAGASTAYGHLNCQRIS